jgi:uncharacterized protein (DUF1697 family)
VASAHVIFVRAANVGGSGVFSTAALAKKLDLLNVGAAGTFVARGSVSPAEIAREIPFPVDLAIRPAAEVLRLVDAGAPRAPKGAQVFVSVLVAPAKQSPRLPLEVPDGRPWTLSVVAKRGPYVVSLRRPEQQRGLDLSAVVEKAFGARSTTRGWPTFERIAAAVRSLEAPAKRARR